MIKKLQESPYYFIKIAIIAICALQSLELFRAWYGAPLEKGAWIAFAIWCMPILIYFAVHPIHDSDDRLTFFLLGAALLFSIFGTIGDFNTFHYLSLALALAALLPPCLTMWLWLPVSLSWMPAFGWIGSSYFPGYTLPTRLALCILASIGMVINIFYHRK